MRFIKNDAAFEFEVQVPRDADILTMKPKAITTDQQDKREELDEQTDENDMAGEPQQGQRGQRAGGPGGAPARRPADQDLATSSTTWRPARSR